jgi:uncharacterized membrane protein YphA (DoxX/SURF4 family)
MSTTYDSAPARPETASPVGTPWLAAAGRVIYAVPFAIFGLFHLVSASAMAGEVPAWVPGGGALWVVVTGIAMVAASVSLLTDRLTRWSGPLLALLLGVYVLTLHIPGVLAGEPISIPMLLKDVALAGAAVAISARKR